MGSTTTATTGESLDCPVRFGARVCMDYWKVLAVIIDHLRTEYVWLVDEAILSPQQPLLKIVIIGISQTLQTRETAP